MTTHTEIMHGYTLTDLHRFTRMAVTVEKSADLYEEAWDGVVDALLGADTRPTRDELVLAGRYALKAWLRKDHAQRGYRRGGEPTPAFGVYWQHVNRSTPSPEGEVVERVAVEQIWPTLRPSHQRVLSTLGSVGCDNARAAAALSLTPAGCMSSATQARSAFLKLWHEGETPAHFRRWSNRKPPTSRWTPEVLEQVRDRQAAGERLADIAVDYGVTGSTLSKALRGRIRARESV